MATVLIVDDEQPLRELLADVLESEGHHVLLARNGREALALIVGNQPDLVVSDVMMPLLNGVRLCRQLKAEPATAMIPVILMSSVGPTVAAGAGADAFISKPFDIDEVESVVRTLLIATANPASSDNAPSEAD